MLDLDDIQHFLLARPPALSARYEFLHFRHAAAARAWLAVMRERVRSARAVQAADASPSWVTLGFTWNGLRALGVPEASLASFPEEFRQGMAARATMLGLTGASAPERWVGELASPSLHAIAILFARDAGSRDAFRREHEALLARLEDGVERLSGLDLDALPPFDDPREHFGYRDRLSQLAIEGTGETPQPGSGPPLAAGELFLGHVDESGVQPIQPQPDTLSKNGSYVAYLRMEEHVAAFREFLAAGGRTRDEQELLAAKLMGRWRSGAPLVLAPDQDDPELARDPRRTNDFSYAGPDPYGYACPVGAHIRRMNPRDTSESMERHRMVRRGATYGPLLADGAPDDGVERGIAAFVGCASLVRQFEFAMNVWANDTRFKDLDNERDPFVGTHDGSYDFTIPRRPVRRKIEGLPAFTTVRGGAYFFVPGLRALRWLAGPKGGLR
jgi:Dyp-type peroxidase family